MWYTGILTFRMLLWREFMNSWIPLWSTKFKEKRNELFLLHVMLAPIIYVLTCVNFLIGFLLDPVLDHVLLTTSHASSCRWAACCPSLVSKHHICLVDTGMHSTSGPWHCLVLLFYVGCGITFSAAAFVHTNVWSLSAVKYELPVLAFAQCKNLLLLLRIRYLFVRLQRRIRKNPPLNHDGAIPITSLFFRIFLFPETSKFLFCGGPECVTTWTTNSPCHSMIWLTRDDMLSYEHSEPDAEMFSCRARWSFQPRLAD